MPIHFFTEDIKFTLKNKSSIRQWLSSIAAKENVSIHELNYILCSDSYLLQLNVKHLHHITLTDIITFDNSLRSSSLTSKAELAGDIFISLERVKENASTFNVSFEQELHRVIVHGLLHLIGYKDKKPADKKEMRTKEDKYLASF